MFMFMSFFRPKKAHTHTAPSPLESVQGFTAWNFPGLGGATEAHAKVSSAKLLGNVKQGELDFGTEKGHNTLHMYMIY